MNELQEIEVIIHSDGRVEVDIRGVKGAACLDITREMEQLLGGKVLERNFTSEYDMQPDGDAASDWQRQGD